MYSASMEVKRAALATLVKNLLDAGLDDATAFVVNERVRETVLRSASRQDRIALMGDPVRYATVRHEGDGGHPAGTVSQGGALLQTAHRFGVVVWLHYADHDTHAQSSQALWDRLVEGVADSDEDGLPDGLLPHLRSVGTLSALGPDGEPTAVYVDPPEEVEVYLVELEAEAGGSPLNAERCHRLEFAITLT